MIAGFLSRFGKIGVIVGFIAGNIVLSYVSNGNTQEIIYLKEIIVASLGLLLVPKKIQINVADFFRKGFVFTSWYCSYARNSWNRYNRKT